jgi:hypothetical protein
MAGPAMDIPGALISMNVPITMVGVHIIASIYPDDPFVRNAPMDMSLMDTMTMMMGADAKSNAKMSMNAPLILEGAALMRHASIKRAVLAASVMTDFPAMVLIVLKSPARQPIWEREPLSESAAQPS